MVPTKKDRGSGCTVFRNVQLAISRADGTAARVERVGQRRLRPEHPNLLTLFEEDEPHCNEAQPCALDSVLFLGDLALTCPGVSGSWADRWCGETTDVGLGVRRSLFGLVIRAVSWTVIWTVTRVSTGRWQKSVLWCRRKFQKGQKRGKERCKSSRDHGHTAGCSRRGG